MINYFKAIIQAVKNENTHRRLIPKCWRCGSKKKLQIVNAPGTYYECNLCKDFLNK